MYAQNFKILKQSRTKMKSKIILPPDEPLSAETVTASVPSF